MVNTCSLSCLDIVENIRLLESVQSIAQVWRIWKIAKDRRLLLSNTPIREEYYYVMIWRNIGRYSMIVVLSCQRMCSLGITSKLVTRGHLWKSALRTIRIMQAVFQCQKNSLWNSLPHHVGG